MFVLPEDCVGGLILELVYGVFGTDGMDLDASRYLARIATMLEVYVAVVCA